MAWNLRVNQQLTSSFKPMLSRTGIWFPELEMEPEPEFLFKLKKKKELDTKLSENISNFLRTGTGGSW